MHIARYFVGFRDGEWKIRYADTYYGPYDRQKTAISQAIDMALIVGQSGGKAEVLVEGADGEPRLEWPLSHDLSAIEERRFWASYGAGVGAAVAASVPEAEPEALLVAEPDVPPAAQHEPDDAAASAEESDMDALAHANGADEDAHDDDAHEGRTPPQGSSIEELAAIMTAALDGAEPSLSLPAPEPDVIAANDEGPPLSGDEDSTAQ